MFLTFHNRVDKSNKNTKAYEIFYPPILRNFVALAGIALASGSVLPFYAQEARLPYQDDTWIRPTVEGATGKVLSKRECHFYNAQNNLARTVTYSVRNRDGLVDLTLEKYTCYDYDAQGRLATSYTRNTRYSSDRLSKELQTPKDSVIYTYNDHGQLAERTEKMLKTVYSYDADGNLYQESVYVRSTGVCMKVLTYSGYVAPKCPSLVSTDSELYDYYNCKEAYTYTSDFKPLTYEKWTEKRVENPDAATSETKKIPYERYEWIYSAKDGTLEGKVHYGNNNGDYETSGIYRVDSTGFVKNDDGSCIESVSYVYRQETNSWIENTLGRSIQSYYQNYNGGLARKLTVKAVKGSINDYEVTFDLPIMGNYRYYIYKDGQLLKEAKMSDEGAVNPNTMKYTYTDKDVVSGLHDYFVQTVSVDERGRLIPMNISNTVSIMKSISVPPVENLHVVSYTRDREAGYYVKVAWEKPANADEFKWQRNNVYVGKTIAVPSNTNTDGQETDWDVQMDNKNSKETVRVEAVYATGKAEVSIDLYMNDIIDGISQVVSNGVDVTYANHVLLLSAPANVKVYTVSGKLEKAVNAVSSVSLENENVGNYILLIENEGKVNVLKVQR